jgi:capsular polysaccharide biosynthesis protein
MNILISFTLGTVIGIVLVVLLAVMIDKDDDSGTSV